MALEIILSAAVGLLAALVGAGVLVVGWSVSHRRALERSLAAQRRELRVRFLIDAYQRLEYASNRSSLSREAKAEIERTFADIHLFGTPRLLEVAQSIMKEWASQGGASLSPLLEELRQSLRSELCLEPVPREIRQLRLGDAIFPNYGPAPH